MNPLKMRITKIKPQEFFSDGLSREKDKIKLFLESLEITRNFGRRQESGVRIERFMRGLKEEGRIHYFNVIDHFSHPEEGNYEFTVEWAESSLWSGRYDPVRSSMVHRLVLLAPGIVAEDNNMSNLKENTNERRGILF